MLITDGAEYIKSHITEQPINRKYDVILDNLKTNHKTIKKNSPLNTKKRRLGDIAQVYSNTKNQCPHFNTFL